MREKEGKGKNGKGTEQQSSNECFVARLIELLRGGGSSQCETPSLPHPNPKLHTSSHFMTSSKLLNCDMRSSPWDDHYLFSKLQCVLVPLQAINQLQSSYVRSSHFTTILNSI